MHPDGYGKELDEDALKRLEHIALLRETVRRPLMHFAHRTSEATDAYGQAQALAELFEELGLAEKLQARSEELEAAGAARTQRSAPSSGT